MRTVLNQIVTRLFSESRANGKATSDVEKEAETLVDILLIILPHLNSDDRKVLWSTFWPQLVDGTKKKTYRILSRLVGDDAALEGLVAEDDRETWVREKVEKICSLEANVGVVERVGVPYNSCIRSLKENLGSAKPNFPTYTVPPSNSTERVTPDCSRSCTQYQRPFREDTRSRFLLPHHHWPANERRWCNR